MYSVYLDFLRDPKVWLSFLTLSLMEIVLGIDNVIFISLLVSKLPPERQLLARTLGLSLALVMRVIFLVSIVWITRLVEPVFEIAGMGFS